jgi:hypothetical protein
MEYDTPFFQRRLEHQLVMAGDGSLTEADRNRRRPKIVLHFSGKRPAPRAAKPSLAAQVDALSRHARTLAGAVARTTGPLPPPERISVAEIEGRTLWAPATNWKRVCYYMLSAGLDPGLARFLRRILPPGCDFIDVGAGLGAYTLLAASVIGDGVTHAFEADPETYRWLVSNVSGTADRIRTYPLTVESSASVMREIAVSQRPIAMVRIGGETTLLGVLGSVRTAIRAHPHCRVVVEYCAALHGRGTAGALVEEAAGLGLTARRISGATGEVESLSREDLHDAFSIHLLLEQRRGASWTR